MYSITSSQKSHSLLQRLLEQNLGDIFQSPNALIFASVRRTMESQHLGRQCVRGRTVELLWGWETETF